MKKVLQISQIIIITGIISIFFSLNLKSQTYQDSCFRLIWEHNPSKGRYNPDSVMYDSCKCGDIFEYYYENQIFPFQYFYADRWFWVNMPNGSLDVPQAPSDTIIERNWTDISSSFTNLRNDFENLENTFGNFILRKMYPEDIYSSSDFKVWLIKFNNYVNIDNVVYFLGKFEDFKLPYPFPPYYNIQYRIYSTNTKDLSNSDLSFMLYPNPAINDINICSNRKNIKNIEILDVYGKVVLTVNLENSIFNNRINISSLPNGLYFIKIDNMIGKFIKGE